MTATLIATSSFLGIVPRIRIPPGRRSSPRKFTPHTRAQYADIKLCHIVCYGDVTCIEVGWETAGVWRACGSFTALGVRVARTPQPRHPHHRSAGPGQLAVAPEVTQRGCAVAGVLVEAGEVEVGVGQVRIRGQRS